MTDPVLAIVMPVYNEELGIRAVISTWVAMLNELRVPYEFLVYNDGSKDATRDALDQISITHPQVTVIHQSNRGHGPTIHRGYREARAAWVFQTDSDDEIPADAFSALWQAREGYDAVFGIRTGRPSGFGRKLLTRGASSIVRLLYGRGPRDVNVPFRLIRRDVLQRLLPRIPQDTFAPNVILSGLIGRERVPFTEVAVPAVARRLGQTSIGGFKALRLGLLAARQTVAAARADQGGAKSS